MRTHVNTRPEPISALTLLQQLYPGQARLATKQVAAATAHTHQSVRTMRCRGTFPIQSADGRTYDIRDVAAYLDRMRSNKPRRTTAGAPTKIERKEAAARGITVKELRAQGTIEIGGAA